MLAALTLGLSGCESEAPSENVAVTDAPPSGEAVETIVTRTIEVEVIKGITDEEMETLAAIAARVGCDADRLAVKAEGEGAGTATVSVSYDCAFETGEITIEFLEAPGVPGATITDIQPVQPLTVSRGKGEAVFVARGSGGATNWLLVGLRATTAECRDPASLSPPSEFQPGLCIEDDCAVWKVIEYPKDWSQQE
jgi:hypothetical protein